MKFLKNYSWLYENLFWRKPIELTENEDIKLMLDNQPDSKNK